MIYKGCALEIGDTCLDIVESAVGWRNEARTAGRVASGPIRVGDIGSGHHVGAVGKKRLRRSCIEGEVK